MKTIPPDYDYEYIGVVLTPEEEKFVERAVNIIYYTALSLITVLGLIWLANRPFKK